jgi:hypothetical protein
LPKVEKDNEAALRLTPQQILEEHIIRQTKLFGFDLERTLRPHNILKHIPEDCLQENGTECHVSLKCLEDAHAVLFVLSKK